MKKTLILVVFILVQLFSNSLYADSVKRFECKKCHGKKKIVCTYCNGSRKSRIKARHSRSSELPCTRCNETGKRVCYNCCGDGEISIYPVPEENKTGWLKLNFHVKSRKGKPAPSWVELIVDEKVWERITGSGRDRFYDFKKIPLYPGNKHRLRIRIYFARGIHGYHHAEAYLHNFIIKNGHVTENVMDRIKLPSGGDRVEDWEDVYTVLFKDMNEAGKFVFTK